MPPSDNAGRVAGYLAQHPKMASVNYLGHLKPGDPRAEVFERQCKSAGSTFSFSIRGGEAEAFRMLDALQVMKLAVSLGGTETLISHPASTTHSGVPKETRDRLGITDAHDPHLGGHRERRRPDRGSGAGAREDLKGKHAAPGRRGRDEMLGPVDIRVRGSKDELKPIASGPLTCYTSRDGVKSEGCKELIGVIRHY